MFLIAYKHSSITTQGPARRYLENGRYFSKNTVQDEDIYYTLKLIILLLFFTILHQQILLLFFTNSNHLYSSSILCYSSLTQLLLFSMFLCYSSPSPFFYITITSILSTGGWYLQNIKCKYLMQFFVMGDQKFQSDQSIK